MANAAKQAVNSTSGFILIAYPLTFLIMIFCLRLNWEDVQTTVAGYKIIGTAKVGDTDQLGYAVAFLLSATPVAMGYWYSRNTDNILVLFGAIICLVIDVAYDMSFKIGGFGDNPTNNQYIITLAETLGVYTIGTEILLAWCLGFLKEGLVEFSAALILFIPSLFTLLAAIVTGFLTGGGYLLDVARQFFPKTSLNINPDDEQSVNVTVTNKPQPYEQKGR